MDGVTFLLERGVRGLSDMHGQVTIDYNDRFGSFAVGMSRVRAC